jgi:hypothetical protein
MWGGPGVESCGRGIRLQVLWVAFFGSEYACLMVVLLMFLFPVVCSCRPLHPRSGCRVGLVLGAAVQGSFELHYPNLRMQASWRAFLSRARFVCLSAASKVLLGIGAERWSRRPLSWCKVAKERIVRKRATLTFSKPEPVHRRNSMSRRYHCDCAAGTPSPLLY